MVRFWVACAAVLFPLLGIACESADRHRCKKQVSALVAYRTQAIEGAFGDVFGLLPGEIEIKFVTSRDPEYTLFAGTVAYDQRHRTLIFPRRLLGAKTPNPLRWAVHYWPFYQNEQYREEFPLIQAVDNALWGAYLQEAANARNLTWPHEDCRSVDVGKRLPCEMMVEGVAEHLTALRGPLFNSNRLDRIWPEDFLRFRTRVWREDPEYQDVLRYGGILLIRPLIGEFGVPRTLTYIAQTPFRVEENNLRLSALRYQDRAREVLTVRKVNTAPLVTGPGHPASWQPASGYFPRGRAGVDTADPTVAGRSQ